MHPMWSACPSPVTTQQPSAVAHGLLLSCHHMSLNAAREGLPRSAQVERLIVLGWGCVDNASDSSVPEASWHVLRTLTPWCAGYVLAVDHARHGQNLDFSWHVKQYITN